VLSTPGDRLVPGHRGFRRLTSSEGRTLLPAPASSFPDDHLGDRLADLTSPLRPERASWSDWANAPLLLASTVEEVKLTPRERQLEHDLPHLQQVVQRPRSYLRAEEDVIAAERAQRVARRAEAHIVAHSENWARLSARRITPRRVLAQFPEPDYDIYENRVTLDLIRCLRRELPSRINQLRGYEQQYECLVNGTPAKKRRTSEVWGQSVIICDDGEAVSGALEELRALLRGIRRLSQCELLQRLRSAPAICPPLKATNILTHDGHYRVVGGLWRAWVHDQRAREHESSLLARRQKACRDYDDFCLAAVLRALTFLGFELATDGDRARAGDIAQLRGPAGDATLSRNADGVITVACGAGEPMRLVPVYDHLTASASPEAIRRRIDALAAKPQRIVLFPAEQRLLHDPEGRADECLPTSTRRELSGIPTDRPAGPYLVQATPHDLLTVERLGRLLRHETWRPLLLAGFNAVDVPALARQLDPCPAWLACVATRLRILQLPAEGDLSALNGAFARADRALRAQGRRGTLERARLGDEHRRLLGAVDASRLAARCPICRSRRTRPNVAEGDGEYVVACDDCHAGWGVSRCPQCNDPAPWLLPAGAEEYTRDPGAIERDVGLDAIVSYCCGKTLWNRRWIADPA
jgi:hypothetical protein